MKCLFEQDFWGFYCQKDASGWDNGGIVWSDGDSNSDACLHRFFIRCFVIQEKFQF
jgi:hypothetical protein